MCRALIVGDNREENSIVSVKGMRRKTTKKKQTRQFLTAARRNSEGPGEAGMKGVNS